MSIAVHPAKPEPHPLARLHSLSLPWQWAVALACLSSIIGLFAIAGTVQELTGIWQTDALKSVGLAVPFVCFGLVLRDWRNLGWPTEGSWLGFALLAAGVILLFLRDQSLLLVTVNKDWLLQLPPLPLIAVAYAASLVLLFGGPRLLRAAWFPVLLMWAVIPVPQTFSRVIDVPLQHAGAAVARSFAHLLGVHLAAGDLKIMFSPDTTMFIAPGCDGLRGAITMGLVAIVVAYVYRFRWSLFLPVVAAGVLLGYVFNFARLCAMVIYDRISVDHPILGPHEQLADHIVGACIFVAAVSIFFAAIEKLKHRRPAPPVPQTPPATVPAWPLLAKSAAVLSLALLFGADYLHGRRAEAAIPDAYPALPETIGSYHLVGRHLDVNAEGVVVYTWGHYAAPSVPGTAPEIVQLGISPRLSLHDAEVCHIARGEDPIWHGQLAAATPGGPVQLTAVMYNNGVTQKLDASTVCDGTSCQQFSQQVSKRGDSLTLVFSHPHKELPLQAESARPVPVLLKVESNNVQQPLAQAQPQMTAILQRFLAQANLAQLTAPYGRHQASSR